MIPNKRPVADLSAARIAYDCMDTYHDDFCETDDPGKKSDALRLLKGYAAEYLNNMDDDNKFRVLSVGRVLAQSIQNKNDFDPREASGAFEHLAKYVQNLLDQPWREEFKTLFLSSGYYVHNIQQYLQNPHEVLISMGYTNIDDSTLQLASMPNPSELKRISRDCFLASQECFILGQIMDFVQTETKQVGITPAQVNFYRKQHLGDVETIGKQICSDIRLHQHTESLKIQQQQQQVIKNSRQHPQEFEDRMELDCPVGNLVDVDDANKGTKVGREIPEREMVQKILRNTEREQEHIYDPVSIDDSLMSTAKFQMSSNMHTLSPSFPSINSSSSNFIYPSSEPSAFVPQNNNYAVPYNHSGAPADFGLPDPEQQHQRNLEQRYSTRSSTASPYIPQTVSAYFGNNAEQGMSNVDGDYSRIPSHYHGSSSSSSSGLPYQIMSKLPQHQQAFQKHKVSQDELRRMTTAVDSNSSKYSNDASSKSDWQLQQFESSFSSKSPSRPPLGTSSENTYTSQSRPKVSTSPQLDDPSVILQEALRYNNQVNSFAEKSRKSTLESSQPYHLGQPSLYREPKEEREASYSSHHHRKFSDSERESGNRSSAPVSSETSSWDNLTDHNIQGTEKSTHFTDGVRKSIDCCDASSIPVETEYQSRYRNPGPALPPKSPSKSPPTETNLDSLQTVFYNKLICKESTDQNQENYHQQYPANRVDDLNKTFPSQNKKTLPRSSNYGVKETSLDDPQNDKSTSSHRAYNSQSLAKKESSSNVQGKDKKIKDRQRQPQESEFPALATVDFEWSCPHCTFINHKDDENDKICDICAKSRDFVPEVKSEIVQPTSTLPKLYSTPNEDTTTTRKNKSNLFSYASAVRDGRQIQSKFKDGPVVGNGQDKGIISCPHCTFLNPKNGLNCECCNERLK